MLSACSLFIFLLNVKFSEEFTGGVSLSLSSTTNISGLEGSLHNYLDARNYPTSRVFIDTNGGETKIKINAQLNSDEQVAQLSEDVRNFLLQEQVIQSPEEII
jgi:preprotein translocase subunit SecF